MGLMNALRKEIKESKLGSSKEYIDSYRTGYDYFDYKNGMFNAETKEYVLGLNAGSILTVVGKSGSGKTTLAIQMAANLVDQFDEAQIIHLDFERATRKERILTLTGWSEKHYNEKYMLLNSAISAESVYELAKGAAKVKLENKEQYQYDTGKLDLEGNPIMELPPTVIIIDSIATMFSKNINDEDALSGQMSASAQARANNAIFKRLVGSSTLEEGNIILICVNHVTQKISINPMMKPSADVNFLKPDESVPGGTSPIYLANVMIKIDPKTKLDPNASSSSGSKFGIKGFVNQLTLIKSRSAEAGLAFEYVYEQTTGYREDLTALKNMGDLGYLKGNGRAYYIEACPDVKFTNKTFPDKYAENAEFKKAWDKTVEEVYQDLVPKKSNFSSSDEEITYELVSEDEEGKIFKGSDGLFYDENRQQIQVTED